MRMFGFSRPKFGKGMLVSINLPEGFFYVLIQVVRKVRPKGERKKQWVYDGAILRVSEGRIAASGGIYCILETEVNRIA